MKNFLILTGVLIIVAGLGFFFVSERFIDPQKNAQSLLERGILYFEQNTEAATQKAIEEFTTVAATYPELAEGKKALFYLARCYQTLGMNDIALAKYLKLSEGSLEPKLTEQLRFQIARLHMLRSYSEEGYAGLSQLLTQTHDFRLRSEIYTEMARYYLRQGNLAKAREHFEIALRESADNNPAREELKKLQPEEKKPAEDPLRQLAAESDSDQVRKQALQRGLELFQENRDDSAIRYFQLVFEKYPDSAEADEALYQAGNIAFRQNDFTAAIKYFNQAISNQPKNRDEISYIKKGEAYYQRKDYLKAIGVFEAVLKIYPKGQYHQVALDWLEEAGHAYHEGKSRLIQDPVLQPKIPEALQTLPAEAPETAGRESTPRLEAPAY